ncbi:MAG: hypothetical protein QM767_11090 [Anaeromyxobacter sp.]
MLETPGVHRYYTRYYPLLLPELLRCRLEGSWSRQLPVDGAEAPVLFARFLDVNAILDSPSQSDEIETFLWLLDAGSWGTVDITAFLELLRDPEEMVKALQTPAKKASRLGLAVHGFREFLVFCSALDALLQSCPPQVAAAFWHQHAYWFKIVRQKVASTIDQALAALSGWEPPATGPRSRSASSPAQEDDLATLQSALDARESMERLREVVRRLTGGAYGASLGRSRQR